MQSDQEQSAILLNMKPEVTMTFWCNNCQCEREMKDKRRTVVMKAGRNTGVTRCKVCLGKKAPKG